jgi:hypothetical protein
MHRNCNACLSHEHQHFAFTACRAGAARGGRAGASGRRVVSAFVETSVRETIERRRTRAEFIARGLVSREAAKRTGAYIAADAVHDDLAKMLADAKAKLSKAPRRARR